MKPGYRRWATNAVWAAGVDVGQPSKSLPTAGHVADGYTGSLRVAPAIWNLERFVLTERLNNVAAMRPYNYTDTLTMGGYPIAGTNLVRGTWDEVTNTVLLLDGDTAGIAITRMSQSFPGGLDIQAGGTVPSAGDWGQRGMAVAVDQVSGTWGVVLQLAGAASGNQLPVYEAGAGWLVWAGVSAAQVYANIAWGDGVWFAYDQNGTNLHISTGVAVPFAAPGTPPALAGGVGAVAHNRHAAGDVYPDDAGNLCAMIISTTQVSHSTDSGGGYNVWSAAVAHAMANFVPYQLGYSKLGSIWGCACIDSVTGFPHVALSTDNGATWVKGAALNAVNYTAGGNPCARIATDGFGQWVLALLAATPGVAIPQFYASIDDGVSWDEVWLPITPTVVEDVDVFYGGGRFWVACNDTNPVGQKFSFTLRAGAGG